MGCSVTLRNGVWHRSKSSRFVFRCFSHHLLPNRHILFFQKIDKEAKAEVDAAVEVAKASPDPTSKDLWTDIYYKGTEPPLMRGREREEVCFFFVMDSVVQDFFLIVWQIHRY